MTEQGAEERRGLLRPRLAVPAGLAALLLVGGSVWALSGGGVVRPRRWGRVRRARR